MEKLIFNSSWLKQLLPEGMPIPSSTILTGPGGSGKPLIGNLIVADWLTQGGSVIFMSLQYPDHRFIKSSLKTIAQLDLDAYQGKVAFIELDVSLEGTQIVGPNHIKANVVKPDIWNQSIQTALEMLPKDGPGVLLFGSALNLLLFSPTYGADILEEMKKLLKEESSYSVLFSTSTSAKGDQVAELDSMTDNLIYVRHDQASLRLFVKIERVRNAPFFADEVEVPFSHEQLEELKQIADQSRKRIVPLVAKL